MKTAKRRERRLAIHTAVLILFFGSACQHLRFPEEASPKETSAEAQTPEDAPSGSWSELAAQGRAAFRANDLPESEKAYLASLAATSRFEASDIRVSTALDNLARLATYYQKTDQPEKAQALVEVLARNAREGRKGDFETASLPITAEANRLAEEEDFESAIDLYRLSLTLIGAQKRVNRPALLSAQWNLMQIYIDTSQITEAESQLKIIRKEVLERFGPDSGQTVGLLLPEAQIQVANGEVEAAEENYRKVIESEVTSREQKALALKLYTEALEGLDRKPEADQLKAEFKEVPQPL